MATVWTVVDPANFDEWGGDDSGLTGMVWQEWVDDYETRRCECWGECWLYDAGPFGGYGGASRLPDDELASLQRYGIPISLTTEARFEQAWTAAIAKGEVVSLFGDAKTRAVRGKNRPSGDA